MTTWKAALLGAVLVPAAIATWACAGALLVGWLDVDAEVFRTLYGTLSLAAVAGAFAGAIVWGRK